MSEPTPNFAGWTSILGPLPTSILPRLADPALQGVIDLILLRQETLAVNQDAIVRRLAALPTAVAASLIPLLSGERSEGLAAAYLAGCQAARSEQTYTLLTPAEGPEAYGATVAPCTLCERAGGTGCGGRCRG